MQGCSRRLVLLAVGLAVGGSTGQASRRAETAPERPAFKLRASPGLAFPPAEVLLTAELSGGADGEDFHCPQIEWDYADGSRSVHQEDCEPLTTETAMERRFTRRHAFDAPGEYQVVVTLRRSDRVVAQATTTIILQGGVTTGNSPDSASLR